MHVCICQLHQTKIFANEYRRKHLWVLYFVVVAVTTRHASTLSTVKAKKFYFLRLSAEIDAAVTAGWLGIFSIDFVLALH